MSKPEIRALPHLADAQEDAAPGPQPRATGGGSAQAYITVSFDIPARVDLSALHLPASVAPTVSPLTDPEWKACEICIPRPSSARPSSVSSAAARRGIVMNDTQGYLE